MRFYIGNRDLNSIMENLNKAPDLLTAKDLVACGLFSDAGSCYRLVSRGAFTVYQRSRYHMWFKRDIVIDYVNDLIKANERQKKKS